MSVLSPIFPLAITNNFIEFITSFQYDSNCSPWCYP